MIDSESSSFPFRSFWIYASKQDHAQGLTYFHQGSNSKPSQCSASWEWWWSKALLFTPTHNQRSLYLSSHPSIYLPNSIYLSLQWGKARFYLSIVQKSRGSQVVPLDDDEEQDGDMYARSSRTLHSSKNASTAFVRYLDGRMDVWTKRFVGEQWL